MSLISYWPAPGLLVPFPGPFDAPLASSGAQATPTDYLTNLVQQSKLLTANPSGTAPAPVDYYQEALYVTRLATAVGVFGGQVVSACSYDSVRLSGGGDFRWNPTSVETSNGGTVVGSATIGRWERVFSGPLYAKWFGAYGDGSGATGHDDIAALDAFYAAIPRGGYGYMDTGVYNISRPWIMATPQTTVRAVPNLFADSGGATINWVGTATNAYAIQIATYGATLEGIIVYSNAAYANPLLGGIQISNTSVYTLSSHNTVNNCTVTASSEVGVAYIKYGFGVATDPTQTSNGNDFNEFNNCNATNMDLWGWHITGSANTIQTRLTRVAIANGLGVPGARQYVRQVAAGVIPNDGVQHPYGGGIWADGCDSVIVDGANFSFVETGFKRTGLNPSYESISNIDSEQVKKLYVSNVQQFYAPTTIMGGRISSAFINKQSIGPDGTGGNGYPASDVYVVDVVGNSVGLYGLNIYIGDNNATQIDSCIRAGNQGAIAAYNCTFPSWKPFAQSSSNPIVSFGNFGAASSVGTPTRVLDGVYKINSGGFTPINVHFDAIQHYEEFEIGILGVTSATTPVMLTAHSNTFGGHWNGSAIVPVTISDAATTTTVTFPVAETNTTYQVTVHPISYTGTPAVGATAAFATSKTTGGFTLTALAAPGVGSSVTYRWEIKSGTNI